MSIAQRVIIIVVGAMNLYDFDLFSEAFFDVFNRFHIN